MKHVNINKRDQIRISTIKHKLEKNVDAVRYIRRMKWGWTGHIARTKDDIDRWTYRLTFWFPINYNWRRGRQPTRWADDFTKYLHKKTYHRMATDRTEWERLQETFALHGQREFCS